ncbi:MAG: Arm DNA-binding domain-containing protein, partial [Maritimibacter harenae]
MAALRKRNGKWQAQVRVKGHAGQSRSFTTKKDAERWARNLEAELEASLYSMDRRAL